MSEIPKYSEEPKDEKIQEGLQEQGKELELTPEIEAMVMEKVQDIDTEGIAYSVIDDGKLPDILKYGLLGQSWEKEDKKPGQSNTSEIWKNDIRKKKAMHVFANIVKRNAESVKGKDLNGNNLPEPELQASYHVRSLTNKIIVLFDPENYLLTEPGGRSEKQKAGTYKADAAELSQFRSVYPWTEWGYLFAYRVPPRFFEGLVFRKVREQTDEEKYSLVEEAQQKQPDREACIFGRYYKFHEFDTQKLLKVLEKQSLGVYLGPIDESDPKILKEHALELAKEQVESFRKKEYLLPIYDVHGNLWWPRQMSYEEVKKFVAEREAKEE